MAVQYKTLNYNSWNELKRDITKDICGSDCFPYYRYVFRLQRVVNLKLSTTFDRKYGNYTFDERKKIENSLIENFKDLCVTWEGKERFTDYSKELNSIISYTDLQISDILHYIEFHKFSAAEGYKLCKKLQEICDRRREAKNKIQIINTIKHQSCASVLSGDATKRIEKIVPDKKYTPRVFDELFKKNQSRIRKEKSVKIKI